MLKEFKIKLPDEPFTTNFSDKELICVYEGNRYLEIAVHADTGSFANLITSSDSKDDFGNIAVDEDFVAVIIDAVKHPIVSALITGQYYYDELEDYVEELATGEEYRVPYPSSMLINTLFRTDEIIYKNGKFTSLKYPTAPVNKESMDKTVAANLSRTLDELTAAKEVGSPAEHIRKLEAMKTWLEEYTEKYKDVLAHKIPYPVFENL